ncbi:MAG: sulfatase [Acidobacteriota bacterium]
MRFPEGSRSDFVVELPGAAHLEYGGIRASGSARLLLATRLESGGETESSPLESSANPGRLDLPGRGRRLVGLSLRAEGAGEVLLFAPRLVGEGSSGLAAPPAPQPAKAAAGRPNIVIFMVDTLRRDALGVYGHAAGLTSNIDGFAERATVFESAVAQSSWTRPSVATMFTGQVPTEHGVTGLDNALPREANTLAERLRDAGYATAAISTNWHVSQQTGLRQGFREFFLRPLAPGAQVVSESASWLDRRPPGVPFLLYLHILDPHAPYAPPADLRRRYAADVRALAGTARDVSKVLASRGRRRAFHMEELRRLYEAEVAATDRAFGELLDHLARRHLDADTMVVFIADHGEEFDEHGTLGHANDLHAEVLNIPFILRLPGQREGLRRTEIVQQIDLLPTLLTAAGLPVPPEMMGLALQAGPVTVERSAFSHLKYNGRECVSLRRGDFKLIVPRQPLGSPELYDLSTDPAETVDIAARQPLRVAYMLGHLRLLEQSIQAPGSPARARLSDEAVRALHALGYL